MLARTIRRKPADGSTHWSSRKLAKELGGDISHMTVVRIWAKHGIKAHLLEGYLTSNDPDFETKAADVIGLYLNPPQNAVVFSVDEKTAIQALDRLEPVLLLSPGRAERHGFEYFRHGTLSLYAAFNTKTGERCWARRPRATPRRNSWRSSLTSWPTSPRAKRFTSSPTTSRPTRPSRSISSWPRTATPTYSSWLNQVEMWFAKIERDFIARGVFTSVPDLKRKFMRYIRNYNEQPKPVKWNYFDLSRRITTDSIVTTH